MTLHRENPELSAVRRLSGWVAFNRALGRCDVHLHNIVCEGRGWRVPFYCTVDSKGTIWRQNICDAYGPTLLLAILNGVQRLTDGPVFRRSTSFACRLALLDMMLEMQG